MTEPDVSRPERLDRRALDRAWTRLASAPAAPWLHAEVARRMGERLAIVKRVPEQVLDWWGELGASQALLAAAYPSARVVEVTRPEVSTTAVAASTPNAVPERNPPVASAAPDAEAARRRAAVPAWRRWLGLAPAAPRALAQADVPPAASQLVWSNMGLQWAPDAPALMRDWHRALAVDGFLMFSTLGPGTLLRLRDLHARQGWGAAYPPWTDMHDLGDMLVEAGFADPVMDQETVRLTWSTPESALTELRALGANTDRTRFAGLRTPRWRAQLHEALRTLADAQGRVALEFEIVYGHAFKPLPRLRLAAETAIGLEDMKARLRGGAGRGER
jgi:malonyl-CoA O-methyltransferase